MVKRRTATSCKLARKELAKLIGNRLKLSRQLNEMPQDEAAKRLGYKNSSQLSKIENAIDSRLPPIEKLIVMAELYEVSIDYILGLTDEWDVDEKELVRRGIHHACQQELQKRVEKESSHIATVELMLNRFGEALRESLEISNQVNDALNQFMVLNKDFEDMKGGAKLVRCVDESKRLFNYYQRKLDMLKIKKRQRLDVDQLSIFEVLDTDG